jgi:hypothetical protein
MLYPFDPGYFPRIKSGGNSGMTYFIPGRFRDGNITKRPPSKDVYRGFTAKTFLDLKDQKSYDKYYQLFNLKRRPYEEVYRIGCAFVNMFFLCDG